MSRHHISVLVVVLLHTFCLGWDNVGSVTKFRQLPDGVEAHAGRFAVRVTAQSDSVVRVRYSATGGFPEKISFAVVPDAGFVSPRIKVTDSAEAILLSTGKFNVRIEKVSMRIVFEETSGKIILQDYPGYPVAWNGQQFRIWKAMPPNEHYFGLGDKASELDHRGRAFTNWNTDWGGFEKGTDPLYKTIPFFIGMSGPSAYGLFLDNTYWSSFDFGKENRDALSFGAEGGELDYYFFYGPDPKAVIGEYTQLTGRMPLPPLFMLGYQQSRWSYFPETRVREVAQEFRNRKIPADAIWLDIDYQKDHTVFTVNRDAFPHFEDMIHDLAQEGFKTILITDLHIKKQAGYKPYDEGIANDEFVKNPDGSVFVGDVWPGPSVFPDFTREATRKWWGTLFTDFVHMGVRGFWNDMNEPSVFNAEHTMPLNTLHRVEDGRQYRVADHREIHNVFGMENVRATHDGLLALSSDIRPVVMTRAGYAGTQRYAATWTGDNTPTWSQLALSVPMLLSLGVSGYPLAGDDIGGFGGSPTPELLTRWIELGTFNTIARSHSSLNTSNHEPWADGPEQEAIRRRYIENRYRLLPYIYTNMEETSRTGLPLMRPMFLEFPSETTLAANDREFMFGHDLLVAPQLSEARDPLIVELPAGAWYDYWTGIRVLDKSPLALHPKLDQLPVFVRAGSIIPRQPVIQHVEEIPQGPLELNVYPGPDCHGSLYADDGDTFAYQRGVYFRVQFSCAANADSLQLTMSSAEGTYTPWWKNVQVTVFGTPRKPTRVLLNGRPFEPWQFDADNNSVSVLSPYSRSGLELKIID
ncbi:MAG: glycoside hydrolase family 31 protein [Terriglobales bacterium]